MMEDLNQRRWIKRLRPLDIAILLVVLAIAGVAVFLGYSMYANSVAIRNSSPATREIDMFVKALKKKPNDIDMRMRLAQALSVAGRDREAVQQYQQILKLNKNFVPALSGVGFELLKRKDWSGGETYSSA
jgi:lipopolysaccharide biosynthesis regulator YciM